ncbi:hypothetical protein M0R89_14795 [Halorussus limi]|uniref:Uncharacterized protein n=1 Tax=Halorussus limi TaxID=2938695 RepID=A0A8U0HS43_9EURY|nr:hypothetical protein [Halorussus limi]UPV73800.1 hypothetical protein M0R89_14795 [Halorussus limi]
MDDPSELTRTLRTEVGDALRMVAVYEETEFDHLYLRDDLDSQYSRVDLEALRREIIVLGLGREKVDEVTASGSLRRIVYETEDVFAVQTPTDTHTGVFVSFDSSKRTRLFDVIDVIRDRVEVP